VISGIIIMPQPSFQQCQYHSSLSIPIANQEGRNLHIIHTHIHDKNHTVVQNSFLNACLWDSFTNRKVIWELEGSSENLEFFQRSRRLVAKNIGFVHTYDSEKSLRYVDGSSGASIRSSTASLRSS